MFKKLQFNLSGSGVNSGKQIIHQKSTSNGSQQQSQNMQGNQSLFQNNLQNNNSQVSTRSLKGASYLMKNTRTEQSPPSLSQFKRQQTEPSPVNLLKGQTTAQQLGKQIAKQQQGALNQTQRESNWNMDKVSAKENTSPQNRLIPTDFSFKNNEKESKSPKLVVTKNDQQLNSKGHFAQQRRMVSEGENWKLQKDKEDNTFRNFNSMTQNIIKEQREPLKEKITTTASEYENLNSIQFPLQDTVKKESHLFCTLHKDKRAKYRVQRGGKEEFLCSKCAIEAAMKHENIVELSMSKQGSLGRSEDFKGQISLLQIYNMKNIRVESLSEEQMGRKRDIEDFIKKLEEVQRESLMKIGQYQEQKVEVNHHYEEQKGRVIELHNSFLSILEKQKNISLNLIEQVGKEQINSIQECELMINQNMNDMENIKSDVYHNIDNILLNMDLKPFKMIITKYSDKILQYQGNINFLKMEYLHLNNIPFQSTFEKEFAKALSSIFQMSKGNHNSNNLQAHTQNQSQQQNGNQYGIKNNFDNSNKDYLKISFDNIELFQNPARESQKIKEIQPQIAQSPPPSHHNNLNFHKNQDNQTNPNELLSPQSVQRNSIQSNQEDCNIIRSPNNAKYLDLLSKVTNNQEKTNNFYQKVIKEHPILSPQAQQFNENCSNIKNPLIQTTDLNKTKNAKDLKNYENFMNFIENKLNQDDAKPASNYQKTLFSSPHFKDQETKNKPM